MNIKPIANQVFIVPDAKAERQTESGIFVMPSKKREATGRGKVVAVGAGAKTGTGVLLPMAVGIGDIVFYNMKAVIESEVDGIVYHVVHEPEIIAKEIAHA